MTSEKQTLLGGESSTVYNHRTNAKKRSWLMIILELLNILLVGTLIFYVYTKDLTLADSNDGRVNSPSTLDPSSKKNIIFMVTDGMGPSSISLARSFKQFRDGLDIDNVLKVDQHFIGSSRTRSSSSLITDSAAGATAFACGLKTYNGAIGVHPDKTPCGTILEALKLQGYYTGLVVTTRITDATPAAFSAHADYRFQEDLIAEQQLGDSPLGRVVDLIIGGGRCHFYPNSHGNGEGNNGCRADNRNLIEEAKADGWSYVGTRSEFDQLDGGKNVTFPLLGLIADTDVPYDIDRNPKEYPSLAEQAKVALTALSKATEDSDKGFFLLIEGSRIDHAGHHNDPAAQVREVLSFDDAFNEVLNFIDETDTDTIVISTSDHETGGLATARQIAPDYPDYLWYPEVLLNSSHSGEFLANKVYDFKVNNVDGEKHSSLDEFLTKEIFENDLGIKDYTHEDIQQIKEAGVNKEALLYALNNLVSVRSQTGWSTHGHSAVDVNIYGYTNSHTLGNELFQSSPYSGLFGNHENIEIGRFMEKITGVSLDDITKKIKGIKHHPQVSQEEIEITSKKHTHEMIIENLE